MNDRNPSHVRIRLAIDVPAGVAFAWQSGVSSGQQKVDVESDYKEHPRFVSTSPSAGATSYPVCPGIPLGSICGWATYQSPPPLPQAVKAFVYPQAQCPTLTNTPAGGAVLGTTADGSRFTWGPNNMIPGAAYSPAAPGAANVLVIWVSPDGKSWVLDGTVQFSGVTGTSGPCGTGSGSGGAMGDSLRSQTFPAIWCTAVAGFEEEALRAFNASWALRRVPQSDQDIWDNSADGTHTPHVRLTLDRRRQWQLTLALREVSIAYTLPFSGDGFGPLRFPSQKTFVQGAGDVVLPAIDVSAM